MKNLTVKIFFLSFVAIFFAGCASTDISDVNKVDQQEIWQKYTIDYKEETDEATITGQLRFGGSTGTTLRLVEPAWMKINEQEMEGAEQLLNGQVYQKVMRGIEGTYVFNFRNVERKEYANSMWMNPVGFDNPPEKINARGKTLFRYKGLPLHENETLELVIEGEGGSRSIKINEPGLNIVTVTPEDIKGLKNGRVTMRYIRYHQRELEMATHLGGLMKAVFTSVPEEAEIVGADLDS